MSYPKVDEIIRTIRVLKLGCEDLERLHEELDELQAELEGTGVR